MSNATAPAECHSAVCHTQAMPATSTPGTTCICTTCIAPILLTPPPHPHRHNPHLLLQGQFTPGKYGEWRWDKRTYSNRPPPRHLGDPPKGMTNELVRHLINSINEATAAIPCWDEYVETGKVVTDCEEVKSGKFKKDQEAAAAKAIEEQRQ